MRQSPSSMAQAHPGAVRCLFTDWKQSSHSNLTPPPLVKPLTPVADLHVEHGFKSLNLAAVAVGCIAEGGEVTLYGESCLWLQGLELTTPKTAQYPDATLAPPSLGQHLGLMPQSHSPTYATDH